MKAVVQRVKGAALRVDGRLVSEIPFGLVVFFGVRTGDGEAQAEYLAKKIANLRIFEDENGKMNIRPADAGAEILIVSQFTLWADARSRRPGFTAAARPETAIPLYERVVALCRESGFHVETGEFGAEMLVESVNNGPVTILLDTREL